MGNRYVFSRKPNPAIFAWDVWNPDEARRTLSDELARADGLPSHADSAKRRFDS